jgi:hypothetical protein
MADSASNLALIVKNLARCSKRPQPDVPIFLADAVGKSTIRKEPPVRSETSGQTRARSTYGRDRTLNACGGIALSETSKNRCIELRIARAYMRLAFVSQRGDGAKAVSLGRFGGYEVLLVELAKGGTDADTQLWIELYDHNLQHGLDSCSCTDIEEATIAARELITRARQLNVEVQPDLGKGQNDV